MNDSLDPQWIDTAEGVAEVADRCRDADLMALDTEADSLHSYFHKVCLIQVTAAGHHSLIDPLAIEPGALEPLWRVVGDPDVPVLMHGADYDVRVLDRDYGARIRGLQDTQAMAQVLGEPKTGLATLLERDVGVVLNKKYQRADWGKRPLGRELRQYAAADTAYLERLAAGLRSRLEELDRWSWAEEEFQHLENVRHVEVEPDPRSFERIKGGARLRGSSRDRLFSLFQWRDARARQIDVPPFKILGNSQMLDLATTPPEGVAELATRDGLGPRFSRRWGREVIEVLGHPDVAPSWRRTPRTEPIPAQVQTRLQRLTAVRDQVAESLGLPGGLVCPKATLMSLAALAAPWDPKLVGEAGLAGWRRGQLEEPFRASLEAT